jgi:hypothetical protein
MMIWSNVISLVYFQNHSLACGIMQVGIKLRIIIVIIVTYEGLAWLIITGSGLDDWIYWHFDYSYNQLQSILAAHNWLLSKTFSIPYWLRVPSLPTVTDLVPIYESVTSSASVVRWLTLHSWTLNSLTNADWRLTYESWKNEIMNALVFFNSGRTAERPSPRTVRVLLCYSVYPLLRNVYQSLDNVLISTSVLIATKCPYSEPLSSSGLFRHIIMVIIVWPGSISGV